MPFDMDCRDRGEPAGGASDAMRQLDRLQEAAEQLGAAELSVLLTVAERLLVGRQRYGALHPDTDPRDFRKEAFEELADAAVYLAAALMKGPR
ncbi:MAG: hypothetical protein ABSA52_21755 [Candidatus Binatia bacterium]|jgi:hypothetical protein